MLLPGALGVATIIASASAQIVTSVLPRPPDPNCGIGNGECGTIWSTEDLCATCMGRNCLRLSTITTPPGCPDRPCTEFTSYPCSAETCPDDCSRTSYIFPTPPRTNSGCPVYISVLGPRCSRCPPWPTCTFTSTISSKCGCPRPYTIITSYECPECRTECHYTEYVYDTTVPNCDGNDGGSGCTPTVTVSEHPGITGGCDFDCSDEFCITDKFVELPCGCTSADSVVTVTDSSCATKSPCWNCHTGFPFTTTATNCGPTYSPDQSQSPGPTYSAGQSHKPGPTYSAGQSHKPSRPTYSAGQSHKPGPTYSAGQSHKPGPTYNPGCSA